MSISPKNDLHPHQTITATIMMSTASNSSALARHNVHQLQGPAILLVEGVREDATVMRMEKNASLQSFISFVYSVHDVDSLVQHDAGRKHRHAQWRDRTSQEAEAIQRENDHFRDLLLVKDVDVYRSLPSKLLHCHTWFSDNFNAAHILKTDDDTFIDLESVAAILTRRPLQDKEWWGNFRREWGVQRAGKWREEDYTPSVYPSFACGSGYVVSRALHTWLTDNADFLHRFQGEDVSMGIWLSPLAPVLIQDHKWQCFKMCQDDMLSMPDLTSAELRQRWHQRVTCSSPCVVC